MAHKKAHRKNSLANRRAFILKRIFPDTERVHGTLEANISYVRPHLYSPISRRLGKPSSPRPSPPAAGGEGEKCFAFVPGVARSSQPLANGRNPFGVLRFRLSFFPIGISRDKITWP